MKKLNNNFIPYGCQEINQSDIDSVIKVLKSPNLTQGPTVTKFENAISNKVNSKYAIAVNSATSANLQVNWTLGNITGANEHYFTGTVT